MNMNVFVEEKKAANLSPESTEKIIYSVGGCKDIYYLRIHFREGTGTFPHGWMPLTKAMEWARKLPSEPGLGKPARDLDLRGFSDDNNTSRFVVAVLRDLQLVREDTQAPQGPTAFGNLKGMVCDNWIDYLSRSPRYSEVFVVDEEDILTWNDPAL